MKEIRYFYVPDAARSHELPSEEATHALRVLRMKAGDAMVLLDGQGSFHEAEVTVADNKHCCYKILRTVSPEVAWQGRIHLAIAPTKMMDRTEWLAEKAVEIGIDALTFLDCQFSERKVLKLPRLEKIVVAAMKQSRKAWLPQLTEMVSVKDFLERPCQGKVFIAHCYEEVPRSFLFDELRAMNPQDEAVVMIGPEGDFSIDEVKAAVQKGCISVSLGDSRLRTETAGLAAVMMMQLAKSQG